MVLSCLPGASLSKRIQSVLSSRPWRPPQDLPRTRPLAIEIVLKVRQNPAPFQNRDSIGNPALQVSLVSPWCLPGKSFPASLVPGCPNPFLLPWLPGCPNVLPPWCLADCPIDPFLPPWCFPSCPNGLSCLPGASDCPMSPFLPPWCLASCQMVLSCLPGASQAVKSILSCLPGASQAVQ